MACVNGSEREAYWRGVVAGCEASGKSIVGYCRDAGISVSKYRWWKGELKRRGVARFVSPLFTEVRPVALGVDAVIEVVLAGERVVRVPRGFDGGTLAEVVRVLEGMGC